MNSKLFIVLVVLLVILAIVGLGTGVLKKSDQKLDLNADGLKQIGTRFFPAQKLSAGDIQSANPPGCLDLFKNGSLAMNFGQSCVFSIKESSRSSRKASFAAGTDQQLRVEARMPLNGGENQMNVKKTVSAPTQPAEVQFFKEGGTLTLWCDGPTTGCTVSKQ